MDDYEYDYFMVRVRRPPTGTDETSSSAESAAGDTGATVGIGVSGVAERLDTGAKHSFRSGAELLDVLLGGQADPKLPRGSSLRNDVPDAAPGR